MGCDGMKSFVLDVNCENIHEEHENWGWQGTDVVEVLSPVGVFSNFLCPSTLLVSVGSEQTASGSPTVLMVKADKADFS